MKPRVGGLTPGSSQFLWVPVQKNFPNRMIIIVVVVFVEVVVVMFHFIQSDPFLAHVCTGIIRKKL